MDIQDSSIEAIYQKPGDLRRWLEQYFYDEDKLKNLCQDLNIQYSKLTGQGINKANDLVEHLVSRKKIPQLINYLETNDSELIPSLFEHFGVRQTNNPSINQISTQLRADTVREEKIPSNFDYEYDVAISFASEECNLAEKLAELLKNKGIKVYFNKYNQAQDWGKNIYQVFQSIFRDKARYCIVFLSKAYREKAWTNHELEQIQARAFKEHSEYILPLRVDDTDIPGINQTTCYISLRYFTLEQVADIFEQKLRGN